MRDERWQRGMRTVLCQFWRLPDDLRDQLDQEPDQVDRVELATNVTRIAAAAHSLASILAIINPREAVYAPPLEHLSDAIAIAHEARANDDLTPEAHIFALMTALHITANSLYGTCILLERLPHASGTDQRKLAVAGNYFAVPAMLVASHLDSATATQRLLGARGVALSTQRLCHLGELLSRVVLHLLCVGAAGQPASMGLPSALLPRPGEEAGPWPGFEIWRRGWRESFGG